MRPTYMPFAVLYALALALGLSLLFNGYLLLNLSQAQRQQVKANVQADQAWQRANYWEQQYSHCSKPPPADSAAAIRPTAAQR